MKKIHLLAIVSGLITFFLMLTINRGTQTSQVVEIPRKKIVEASVDIEPYKEITADMVQITEVEEGSIHPDAILEIETVIGKISTTAIYAKEPILALKIAERESIAAGLALKVSHGKRAISIAVKNKTGVANNLRVGNWVDVLSILPSDLPEDVLEKYNRWAIAYPQYFSLMTAEEKNSKTSVAVGTQSTEEAMNFKVTSIPKSIMLVQNVKVLAIDTSITEEYSKEMQERVYASVTLEVEPEQALMMNLSEYYNSLRLILREQEDHEIIEIEGIILDDILNRSEHEVQQEE